MRTIWFYAPMKAPGHPNPSGDRQIARATVGALRRAGYAVRLASSLRLFDGAGDAAVQDRLAAEAGAEASRLITLAAEDPPALWFTYHCHYKAPDLIGPAVAGVLGVPYAILEPSLSPKRLDGPWARFAAASAHAVDAADLLFWTTERDRPALAAAGHEAKMRRLRPFVEGPGEAAAPPRRAGTPLKLLSVAMMRQGDKLESYRRIAAALPAIASPWRLSIVGDGPARAEVEALFLPFGPRVAFEGALPPDAVPGRMAEADLLLWPGVGEGVGMVWLEAQAAGVPVVAEDGPAARDVVYGGALARPGSALALAAAIAAAARDRLALSGRGRMAIADRHSPDAAAETLKTALEPLL